MWSYKLGGYQVLKKWLSYRERGVLNRPLRPEEVQALHGHGAAHRGDTGAGGGGVRGLLKFILQNALSLEDLLAWVGKEAYG